MDHQLGWTPDDLGRFVEQVRGDRFFAVWMLVTTTGIPFDTVLDLTRGDVDLQQRRITAQVPGRRSPCSREYRLDPYTFEAIREHAITWDKERDVLGQDTQNLFVWTNGQQLDQASARRMFGQHCAAAGVPTVSLNQVRIAYVVAALETGIPPRVISRRFEGAPPPVREFAVPNPTLTAPQTRSTRSR